MSYPDEKINETPLDSDEYVEFLEHLRKKGKLFWDKLPDKEKDEHGWFVASQINHTHLLLFSILKTNVEIWRLLEEKR